MTKNYASRIMRDTNVTLTIFPRWRMTAINGRYAHKLTLNWLLINCRY